MFNCIYIFREGHEETLIVNCVLSYLAKNLGFSLTFGSILVKTYRIYKIFNNKKKIDRKISKKKMLSIVFFITSFHIIMILLLYKFGYVEVKTVYVSSEKYEYEYTRCSYSKYAVL
eukprot:jgi/Orpsp1_1/1186428/evm.model.d7180000050521.1